MPMGEDPRHGLLVALVVGLVGVLLLIFAALAVAPVLVIVLGLMTYVVWWYVSREDTSYMHYAQEHENRFWTTVAFCFSGALVFVHDSPVALGQWSPVLGFLFVMMFTFSVHSYDRQLHRSRIGRAPNFRPSVESSTMLHSSVQDKCRRISLCLSKLDNRLVATNLNHMLWADMVQNLEKEIVNILSDADPSELNYMLPKIGLGLLFYKVKDHAPINLHRTRLLNVLADNRISDLNVTSRALVLDALQQLKLSAHKDSEAYAKKIILKTKGDDLSELKSLTDAKGDIHSIHKLVYRDIKDVAVREEVLKHIANQAKVQAAHMRLGTRTGSRRSGKAWRKILSDVDDTLTSSGGRFPAGVDARYPRKSVYPGVLDFYRELDLGVNGPSEWPHGQLGNLVFLSARPHVYKDMSESKSYAKFKKLQDEKGLYTSPTLLAGSIDTGTTMLLTGNMEPVAEKKFQNFAEYVSLYPEFQHVFVGDNGQGDVRAAEMMAKCYPGKLEAVYMHKVVPEEKTFGYQGAVTREAWKKANIVFVGDYVEAACHAYKHGLIQAVGLQRVCQGAVEQFVEMKFEGPLMREQQRRQINQSVWQANKLLQAAELEPNWLIRAERAFDDMEAVLTPFGRGTVVNFRPEDGVYEVLLDWSQKVSASAAPRSTSAKASTAPVTPLTSRSAHAASRPNPQGPAAPRPKILPTQPPSFPSAAAGGLARPASSSPAAAAATPLPAAAVPVPPATGAEMAAGSAHAGVGGPGSEGGAAASAGGDTGASEEDNPGLLLPPPSPLMMPDRGPDAAGGGEAVRDARIRGRSTAAAVTAGSGAATAATAAMAVMRGDGGGAEEAAGGPPSAAAAAAEAVASSLLEPSRGGGTPGQQGPPPSTPLPPPAQNASTEEDAAGEESLAEQAARAAAATALTEAAAEAVQRNSSHGHERGAKGSGDEREAGGSESLPHAGMVRPRSAGSLVGGPGGSDDGGGVGGFSPHGSGDASWRPTSGASGGSGENSPQAAAAFVGGQQHDESVAAAAAKVLTAKMPGSMAVRAYLQLSSLKKAPPEVKKPVHKDEADEPKSGRLSARLSIFSRQQDAGSAGSSRPTAKVTITRGAMVQTFLGPAIVRHVRPEDGMCEVAFQKWVLAGKPALGVLREADLVAETAATVGKSPSLFGRTGKAISSLFKLSAVPAPTPPEPRVGDIVDTIFGPAAVTAVRGGGPAAGLPKLDKTAAGGEEKGVSSRTEAATASPARGAGKGDAPSPAEATSSSTAVVGPADGDGVGVSEGGPAAIAAAATASPGQEAAPPSPPSWRPMLTPPRSPRSQASTAADNQQQEQQQEPWTAASPRPTRTSSLPARPPPQAPPPSSSTVTAGDLTPVSPVFLGLPPPASPPRPSPAFSAGRPRGASISVPGRDDHRRLPFSSGGDVGAEEGLGELGRQLSGSAAGELFPGQLLSSPASVAELGGRVGRRGSSSVQSPADAAAAAAAAAGGDGFDAPSPGAGSGGESGDEEEGEGGDDDATSPLGIRILERTGEMVGGRRASAASPTDAVMYEVAFMKWRLTNNTPARAVLNRGSIWAEWETRPSTASFSSASRKSSRRHGGSRRRPRSSRPSSFFGFMSMVGGYAGGGGGTTKILETPPGSPQKARAAKSPSKAASVPLHSCDFPPGACVKTKELGPALVTKFRPEDGIYQVSLLSWRSQTGRLASAFLNRAAIASGVALPDAPVRTSMGLGRVKFVREDGFVVVAAGGEGGSKETSSGGSARSPSGGTTTMFLQLSAILGPAKATLGDKVDTSLGVGVVRAYRAASDTYVIDLGWGLLHSPHGSALKEQRRTEESSPLNARSSGGIIKLFRWPLFGSGPSSSAAPFPPLEI